MRLEECGRRMRDELGSVGLSELQLTNRLNGEFSLDEIDRAKQVYGVAKIIDVESSEMVLKWQRTNPSLELTLSISECEAWLRVRMIYGPYSVPRLYAMAEEAGFSEGVLQAAMPAARVERVPGFGGAPEYFQTRKGA